MLTVYYSIVLALLVIGYQFIKQSLMKRRPFSKVKRLKQRVEKSLEQMPQKLNESWIMDKVKSFTYQQEIQNELYESVLQLKNMAMNEDEALGTEYTLELLMRFTKRSQSIYAGVLSRVRQGEKEQEIKHYYKERVHSSLAEDFLSILLKMDRLHPRELKEQIITYQEHIRQERITKKAKNEKIKSDVAYFFFTAGAIIIMANFLLVAIWPQMQLNL